MRKRKKFTGQHFHIYLIAYGTFRFGHEIFRATPKIFGALSGYQIAAILVIVLGTVGFAKRKRNPAVAIPAESNPTTNPQVTL